MDELAAMANGKARQDMPVRTHQASGFQWQRAEDEPGYGWLNKKAVDEFSVSRRLRPSWLGDVWGVFTDHFE